MKFRLHTTPAADADLDEIASFIAQDNLPAALRFYDAVDITYQQICNHPNRYPRFEVGVPRLAGIRRRSVVGFSNYLVFYRVENENVLIIRVLHGARDLPRALEREID